MRENNFLQFSASLRGNVKAAPGNRTFLFNVYVFMYFSVWLQ
jgi:hypothetical protein